MEKPGFLGYYAGAHWFHGTVALVLICLFSLWLVFALLDAEEAAEKMVVEGTVRNMRVGLNLAMREAIIAGRDSEISGWAGSNPLRWLGTSPGGDLGDCPAVGHQALPEAAWCFDRAAGQLLYRPRHGRYLQMAAGADAEKVLRWRVVRQNRATDGRFVGVSVELVTPYRWVVE